MGVVQRYFIDKLAFAVFAALTPHRQPSPKNGLRHFSALPTRHPTGGGTLCDTQRTAQYVSAEKRKIEK
ncbi:MAG: hypothetical protein FWC10_09450 [Lentimicrobiaceae bacterium]|nr:hypothetical protein [Lentimicrobiaceae bacterium]